MLCVKTKIKVSEISGIGLFADERILKGTIVWRFEANIDLLFTKEDIQTLSEPAQKQFYNYAFKDKFHQKYMLCGDDARFFNHADSPNCNDEMIDITIAIRDIELGEELTVDYRSFYDDISDHPEIAEVSEVAGIVSEDLCIG